MRRILAPLLVATVVTLLLTASVGAGGGVLVTVKDFPDYAVAGKSLKLTFKLFVPSMDPVRSLKPAVRAKLCASPCSASHLGTGADATAQLVKVRADAVTATGEFKAALLLPEPGDWIISIDTEYEDAVRMPLLKVIASGATPPAQFSPAMRGLRLFTSKGCNGCHLHEDVNDGSTYGPDLTGALFASEYLRRFLKDPSITPVPDLVCSKDGRRCGSPYAMPNLNLTKAEIDALIAFINK